jgi:hypothetical protein
MAQVVIPDVTTYGNTFARQAYRNMSDNETPGEIDVDNLNRTRLSDQIEFTELEEQIRDYVLASLGHPVVRVELVDHQLKVCMDEALTELEYHAPHLTRQMCMIQLTPGVAVYQLPKSIIRNINYVTYKKNLMALQAARGTLEFDFLLSMFQGGTNFLEGLGIGDFYLLQSTMETTRRILGQDGAFEILDGQYLQLHPIPVTTDTAIIEFRGLNSETLSPKLRNWVQRFSTACAKEILGQVRGKFNSVPGPGGGTQLNGTVLLQQAQQEKAALRQELMMDIEEPPIFTTG